MKRLKRLEDENGKLRKLVADLSLDKEILQDRLPVAHVAEGLPSFTTVQNYF